MSLAGFDCLTPSVTFDLLQAPPNITGKDLEQRLLKFEYVDEPRKKPEVEFVFDNTDGKIVNMALLFVGLKMKITFGYEGLRSRPFVVTITKIKAAPVRAPSTESPAPGSWGMITMKGTPQSPKVHWRPEADVGTFRNMKMADIVRQLARRMGYRESQIFVQDGTGLDDSADTVFDEVTINENETLEEFLIERARERGFVFRHQRNEFHWHQDNWKGFGAEVVECFYGPDLLDFSIDGDYNMNVRGVKAKAIDWRKRLAIVLGTKPGDRGLGFTDELSKQDIMTALPAKLRQAAAKRLINLSTNRWLVRATLVGNPKVFRGTAIDFRNFGPFLDGHWSCQGVRHVIDNIGYTTDIGLKHVGKGKSGKVKVGVLLGPPTKEHPGGERTLYYIADTGAEAGKGKRGRPRKWSVKKGGPGKGGPSLTMSSAQKRTAQMSKKANFSGRRYW